MPEFQLVDSGEYEVGERVRPQDDLGPVGRAVAKVVVAVVLMGILGVVALVGMGLLMIASAQPRPAQPGQAAFQAANQRLLANGGQVGFGNTPEAKAHAESFAKTLGLAQSVFFTGGKQGGASLTGGKFLTHCQIQGDRVAFLVHVPQLKRYKGEVRDTLIKLAWSTAKTEVEGMAVSELAVGLRGAINYGGLAIGPPDGACRTENSWLVLPDPLYPFFEEPAGRAAAAVTADGE